MSSVANVLSTRVEGALPRKQVAQDGFVREGSAADLDKPHVVGTLPTAFSNMMFLVQRVDTPDPVRPLRSSAAAGPHGAWQAPRRQPGQVPCR